MDGKLSTNEQRDQWLAKLSGELSDVLVVGGGITGVGIALDAVSRGMSTVLLEMQDFAAGTSSRSTKLIHGGLRYLKQFEVKMVAEVGKERAIVYENGPHVTTPEWMLLPFYKGGTFGKWSTSIGLKIYDFLAGVKPSEHRIMLNREETLVKEPNLRKDGLQGSGYYVEYRTDDARLTIEVLKKAVELGAKAINYVKAEQFLYEGGKIVGVQAVNEITGTSVEIRARKVINAAGPWADTLREKDHSKDGKTLHLTKGVHLVFDQSCFPLQQAVYFDTHDGRMVFAIPRDGKTYVGTTDTNYFGENERPQMTVQDRDYLLHAIRYMFPNIGITANDVESSWAGLRPLIHEEGKNPSEISRKDEIFHSPSGLITIAGGKLTAYRKMAETVVDQVAKELEEEGREACVPCCTRMLPISGGDVGGSASFRDFIAKKKEDGIGLGMSAGAAELLARRYGSNVDDLFSFISRYPIEGRDSNLPCELWIMLMYSLEQEMVVKPVDFFIRRTGALLFDIQWVHQWKKPVIDLMAKVLNWTQQVQEDYTNELEFCLHRAAVPLEYE